MKHVDVLVIGAGISGVCAGYHLQKTCPNKTYAILEARERLGGTWDYFKYPGIRSDSDMYTLGFSFRPWTNPKAIADGPSILAYVRETAEAFGIDKHIRYRMQVTRVRFSTKDNLWTVEAKDASTGEITRMTAGFLWSCAGYYDYDGGYTPDFAGRERFSGRIVHPQRWTDDVEYEGKRVVVIGSGATAVTLVPELSKRAAHVTMLQRSPTYVVSVPGKDKIADWLRARLPSETAYGLTRWKNVLFGMGFYAFCRRFPEQAKRFIVEQVEKQLRGTADGAAHFKPSYAPWDQRVCLVPDSDLFRAIRGGKVSVVTDTIETFTETGIRLASGKELPADLVVTATGLKLKFFGGAEMEVDGKRAEPKATMVYKGMMCSDVPNFAFSVGYTNASWTLKCDLTSEYVCRILRYMEQRGYARCCPRRTDPSVTEEPIIHFSSGYVQRALAELPKQGSVAPWKLHQNYALDMLLLRRGRIEDGTMEFAKAEPRSAAALRPSPEA